jgi:hypothetical protein
LLLMNTAGPGLVDGSALAPRRAFARCMFDAMFRI